MRLASVLILLIAAATAHFYDGNKGDKCEDAADCKIGLFCARNLDKPVCTALFESKDGDECDPSVAADDVWSLKKLVGGLTLPLTGPCKDGLYCKVEKDKKVGKCTKLIKKGGSCDPEYEHCESKAACDTVSKKCIEYYTVTDSKQEVSDADMCGVYTAPLPVQGKTTFTCDKLSYENCKRAQGSVSSLFLQACDDNCKEIGKEKCTKYHPSLINGYAATDMRKFSYANHQAQACLSKTSGYAKYAGRWSLDGMTIAFIVLTCIFILTTIVLAIVLVMRNRKSSYAELK